MTTHTLCFSSLIKKLQTFEILSGLDIEDFQSGILPFFSTQVKIRCSRFATSHTIVFFLNLSKQFMQYTCNIQFIELFYLKYMGVINLGR